mmetsp:Transcript_11955/g.8342  ORF Transcript_11955/g.8342 Transcript_11955/m.8342 type:complete len:218 (-) Transcript_11955:297-950(-)
MREAEPPSVRKDEVAAVTVPWGLMKAGLRAPSFSRVDGRMPLSSITYLSVCVLFIGTSSSLKKPAWVASRAASWERLAKASWSARETPRAAQRRSAELPMTSPVENSATAGGWGTKSALVRPLKRFSFCCVVFIFPSLSNRLRSGREYRIGRSDITSTPPAMPHSICPTRILSMRVAVATLAPMHARVTVCAGTVSGRPAPIAASRATFEVRTSWIT